MTDPTITCPHCGRDIKLTETLAQPFIEAARLKFEQAGRERDQTLSKREAALCEAEAAIKKAKQEIDEQVAAKVKTERDAIARDEAKKASEAFSQEFKALKQQLDDKSGKLIEAQKNELEVRLERQKLQEAREQFELEKQRAIDAERVKIRESAMKDAAEQHRLKEADKDKVINDLRGKIEELQRKAEQGSQQLQGEVQELDLEQTLRTAFPRDTIDPVPKGVHGGDALQHVIGPQGTVVGTILWESKRTKAWSDGWLAKLRSDQREAKADIAAIMTATMPKEISTFGQVDGVWVTSTSCVVPLASVLRQGIIQVASARQASEGRQTKMELVYAYLTGPSFRQRVEGIKEAFETMMADLESEKKVITKQWAKRAAQIEAVLTNTVGMYGDLQGIAGKSIPVIEGLELRSLEAPALGHDTPF